MKIERIYIENFGKLSKFSLDLSSGFNLIFGHNEDGKTTVMSFVRMMFYGSGTQKSDLLCNLRRRYAPLSGEKMGGMIEFTHEGRAYSLQKQFGKTPRSDKTVLLDLALGTPVSLPDGVDVGERFFKMGAGAFERSCYIGSLPPYSDGGYEELSKKLAATVYSGDAGEGYELVRKRLTDAANKIHTPRKVGTADAAEREIAALEKELCDSLSAENRRLLLEKSSEELKDKLETVRRERDSLREKGELLRSLSEKERIEKELDARGERDALAGKLGGFDRIKLSRLNGIDNRLAVLSTRLEAGSKTFSSRFSEEDLKSEETEFGRIQQEITELEEQKMYLESEQIELGATRKTPAKKIPLVLYSLAAVFAVAAAVCGLLIEPTFFAIAGAAFWLAVIAVITQKNIKSTEEQNTRIRERRTRHSERYNEVLKELAKARSDLSACTERIRLIQSEIPSSLANQEELAAEKAEIEGEIALLSREKNDILGGRNETEIASLEKDIARLEGLALMISSSSYSGVSTGELTERLSQFAALDTASLPSADALEQKTGELDGRLEELSAALSRAKTEIEQLFKSRRSVAVIEREMKEKCEMLARYEEHFSALTKAVEVLDEAYGEMRRNFAPELNRMTAEYFSKITDGRYTDATVTSEFNISVRQDGEILPLEQDLLSAGSRDQLDLCLRLALARLTGGENHLPLMLDDVLAQYDAPRTAAALSLIAEYAADTQVLFFTCHDHIRTAATAAGAADKPLL